MSQPLSSKDLKQLAQKGNFLYHGKAPLSAGFKLLIEVICKSQQVRTGQLPEGRFGVSLHEFLAAASQRKKLRSKFKTRHDLLWYIFSDPHQLFRIEDIGDQPFVHLDREKLNLIYQQKTTAKATKKQAKAARKRAEQQDRAAQDRATQQAAASRGQGQALPGAVPAGPPNLGQLHHQGAPGQLAGPSFRYQHHDPYQAQLEAHPPDWLQDQHHFGGRNQFEPYYSFGESPHNAHHHQHHLHHHQPSYHPGVQPWGAVMQDAVHPGVPGAAGAQDGQLNGQRMVDYGHYCDRPGAADSDQHGDDANDDDVAALLREADDMDTDDTDAADEQGDDEVGGDDYIPLGDGDGYYLPEQDGQHPEQQDGQPHQDGPHDAPLLGGDGPEQLASSSQQRLTDLHPAPVQPEESGHRQPRPGQQEGTGLVNAFGVAQMSSIPGQIQMPIQPTMQSSPPAAATTALQVVHGTASAVGRQEPGEHIATLGQSADRQMHVKSGQSDMNMPGLGNVDADAAAAGQAAAGQQQGMKMPSRQLSLVPRSVTQQQQQQQQQQRQFETLHQGHAAAGSQHPGVHKHARVLPPPALPGAGHAASLSRDPASLEPARDADLQLQQTHQQQQQQLGAVRDSLLNLPSTVDRSEAGTQQMQATTPAAAPAAAAAKLQAKSNPNKTSNTAPSGPEVVELLDSDDDDDKVHPPKQQPPAAARTNNKQNTQQQQQQPPPQVVRNIDADADGPPAYVPQDPLEEYFDELAEEGGTYMGRRRGRKRKSSSQHPALWKRPKRRGETSDNDNLGDDDDDDDEGPVLPPGIRISPERLMTANERLRQEHPNFPDFSNPRPNGDPAMNSGAQPRVHLPYQHEQHGPGAGVFGMGSGTGLSAAGRMAPHEVAPHGHEKDARNGFVGADSLGAAGKRGKALPPHPSQARRQWVQHEQQPAGPRQRPYMDRVADNGNRRVTRSQILPAHPAPPPPPPRLQQQRPPQPGQQGVAVSGTENFGPDHTQQQQQQPAPPPPRSLRNDMEVEVTGEYRAAAAASRQLQAGVARPPAEPQERMMFSKERNYEIHFDNDPSHGVQLRLSPHNPSRRPRNQRNRNDRIAGDAGLPTPPGNLALPATGNGPASKGNAAGGGDNASHASGALAMVPVSSPAAALLDASTAAADAAADAAGGGGGGVGAAAGVADGSHHHHADTAAGYRLSEDELSLVQLLPEDIRTAVQSLSATWPPDSKPIMEIVLDEGRPPILKFTGGRKLVKLADLKVCMEEALDALSDGVHASLIQKRRRRGTSSGSGLNQFQALPAAQRPEASKLFGPDNRLGLEGTLHRISANRARGGDIIGLTYRIGRHLPGRAAIFADLLQQIAHTLSHSDPAAAAPNSAAGSGGALTQVASKAAPLQQQQCGSILVVGRPGLGKTTLLRDMSRILADDFGVAVVVVDSSLEIGGAARIPHPALGSARRMEVADRTRQQDTLIEAVQNHAPECVVVDEIGTEQEVAAVRSISQRGIAMVGTAHGTDLLSLLSNPTIVPMLGGVQTVTIGDIQAIRAGGKKTRLERCGPPAFTTLIEVLGTNQWKVHPNLAQSIDRILAYMSINHHTGDKITSGAFGAALQSRVGNANVMLHTQTREYAEDGTMLVRFESEPAARMAGLNFP